VVPITFSLQQVPKLGIGQESGALFIKPFVLGVLQSKHALISPDFMNIGHVFHLDNRFFIPAVGPTWMFKQENASLAMLQNRQFHRKFQQHNTLDSLPLSLSLVTSVFADTKHLRERTTRGRYDKNPGFLFFDFLTTFLPMITSEKIPSRTQIIRFPPSQSHFVGLWNNPWIGKRFSYINLSMVKLNMKNVMTFLVRVFFMVMITCVDVLHVSHEFFPDSLAHDAATLFFFRPRFITALLPYCLKIIRRLHTTLYM
jgi:hypothetical protein